MEETDNQMLSMMEAAGYANVSKKRILDLARTGKIEGATRGEGRTASWQIPQASLDKLRDDGMLKPRKYKRKVKKAETPALTGERLPIAEAAARFGLGRSTLENYVATGKLHGERVQLGVGHRKTFVRTADVAALRAKIPVTKRGKHRKIGIAKKLAVAPQPNYPTGNNAELLRIAEMVKSGSYRVTKLVIGLEFTGGGE